MAKHESFAAHALRRPKNLSGRTAYEAGPNEHGLLHSHQAIEKLPSDEPFIEPNKWYTTQKQHWLGRNR